MSHLSQRVSTWLSYPADAGQRDQRLDFIRGYCVFMMVVDHLGGPSWLYWLTGNNRYIVSAAEGFVLISGIVLGIVYKTTAIRYGFETMAWRAITRARDLYLVFVGLTFARTGLALTLGTPASQPISTPTEWIIGVLTLHQSAYLTDVMLFYTLMVLVVPIPMLLFRLDRTGWALAGSWIIWGVYQIMPESIAIPWPIEQQDAFPFAAWQLLFVNGMAVGYHREAIARLFRRVPRRELILGLLILLALVMLLDKYDSRLAGMVGGPAGSLLGELFYKFDVRPGRVLALVSVFSLFYMLLTIFWRPLRGLLGWLMLPFGERALDAYGVHLFFVTLLGGLRVRYGSLDAMATPGNTLLQIACIVFIWLIIKSGLLDSALGRERRPATVRQRPAMAG